jgi:hypothetical protein
VDHYYFPQEDWAALDREGPQYDAGQTAMSRSPVVSALVLLVEASLAVALFVAGAMYRGTVTRRQNSCLRFSHEVEPERPQLTSCTRARGGRLSSKGGFPRV